MKRLLFLCFCVFFINIINAQEVFKEGYYIDNKGVKVLGLIDDERWLYPPVYINFKENTESMQRKIDIFGVLAFSIDGITFERYTFSIDEKPLRIITEENSSNAEPDLITITAFVKVLVKGKASLYSVFYNGDERFFFTNSEIQIPAPLIYHEYVSNNGNSRKNIDFQKQLFNKVNCSSRPTDEYFKLRYEEKDLIRLFSEYNTCMHENFTVVKKVSNKSKLKITPFIGMSFINHSIAGTQEYTSISSATTSAIKFGADVSLVLPYHHGRYEFFARVFHEKFDVDNYSGNYIVTPTSYIQDHVKSHYSIIYIGVGPRYNMQLNAKNIIYLEGSAGFAKASGEMVYTMERHNTLGEQITKLAEVGMQTTFFSTIGVGYVFNRKIGINLSADISAQDMVKPNSRVFSTGTRNLSLMLTYTIN